MNTHEQRATASPLPLADGSAPWLDALEAALLSIKDSANEMGAGYPPDGYDEIADDARAVADECWEGGLNCMETALRNWIYDQRQILAGRGADDDAARAGRWMRRATDIAAERGELFRAGEAMRAAYVAHIGTEKSARVKQWDAAAQPIRDMISSLTHAPLQNDQDHA